MDVNMYLKKTILLAALLLSVFLQQAFSMDTIKSYQATYTAETNPFFVFTSAANKAGEAGKSYAALLGTIDVYVNRSVDSGNDQSAARPEDDDSAYVKALYFRDPDDGSNKAFLTVEGVPGVSLEAHLYSKLIDIESGKSAIISDAVDVSDPVNHEPDRSQDYFQHLLPAFYRQQETGGNAIWSSGRVGEDAWLKCFSVQIWLRLEGNWSQYKGRNLYIDPARSSFSSISSLAVCHNYNPSKEGGSVIPTTNLGGDLAFFPSSFYNRPIPIGKPSDAEEKDCWLIFSPDTVEFTTLPGTPIRLGTISALIYGNSVDYVFSNNEIEYTISGLHSEEGSKEFRMVKTSISGDVNSRYVTYRLKFRDLEVTSGEKVSWKGLKGGASYSISNMGDLVAYDFDGRNANVPGIYADTITISVTAVN